jgi:hypothetical protein
MRFITFCFLVGFVILSIVTHEVDAQEYIGWEAENFAGASDPPMDVHEIPLETADVNGAVYTISEASGDAFIGLANGEGAAGSWLMYEFNVPVAGDWYFWVRAIAPTGSDNSFYWGLDVADVADATKILDFNELGNFPGPAGDTANDPAFDAERKNWMWFRFISRAEISYDNPTPWNLTGSHTLHLVHREDGAFMDWIYGTTDRAFDANETPPDGPSAVEPQAKLAATWGELKQAR